MNVSTRHIKFNVNILFTLAIFFNAIAPLSVIAKELPAFDDVAAKELFGDKILICTPTGFKYITIAELSESQNDGQGAQQSHCPLCLIKVSATILNKIELSNNFEIEFSNPVRQFYVTKLLQNSTSIFNAAKPRAPPIFL